MTQSDNELLPCPFCGAQPTVILNDSYGSCAVTCSCEHEPNVFRKLGDRDGVVKAWNRRASHPAPCNKVTPGLSALGVDVLPPAKVHDSTLLGKMEAACRQPVPYEGLQGKGVHDSAKTPRTDAVRLRAGGLDNLEAAQEFEKLADSLERKLQGLQERYEAQVALTLELSTKLDAALAQPSPKPSQEEWKWVPVEVTNAMQHAYFEVIDSNRIRVEIDPLFGRYANHRAAYKAMLAAAPSTDSESSKEQT